MTSNFPQLSLPHGFSPHAALIDMDGVLYDSMPFHARAWHRLMTEEGVDCSLDEFYAYEGMTGEAIIGLMFRRSLHRDTTPEEAARLYERKTRYFHEIGEKKPMPGADRMLRALMDAGVTRVLVTGSGQRTLIDRLADDYPGAFLPGMAVTAHDVTNCKPHPEPYLKGLLKAGVAPGEAMVIENAPLGVKAGKNAGLFTVAVTTGPIPREEFIKAGADLIFPSMNDFADSLPSLLK